MYSSPRSFSQRDTKDRIAANNGDFIVRFNLRTPLSTWPCSVPQLRRRRGEGDGGGGGGRGDKDAYEPCTYVSVNDEDYRSFLALPRKSLRLLLRTPFSPSRVQQQGTLVGRTNEPTLRGFIIPFRFALLPADGTLRTKRNVRARRRNPKVHVRMQHTRAARRCSLMWTRRADCLRRAVRRRKRKIYAESVKVIAMIWISYVSEIFLHETNLIAVIYEMALKTMTRLVHDEDPRGSRKQESAAFLARNDESFGPFSIAERD